MLLQNPGSSPRVHRPKGLHLHWQTVLRACLSAICVAFITRRITEVGMRRSLTIPFFSHSLMIVDLLDRARDFGVSDLGR
ncbi:hypothetical protein KIN20_028970 [Parelaphostrongylus tenuis]|uniref:Uncharacterized protein n=1 Tax=Parelaphostrongylus tenuis TaxID=148309 RepID=A0AAD5WF83_PARTN|nr:hypothetical protein KIN20_028970 [Parelaphostrongylus tenuis]